MFDHVRLDFIEMHKVSFSYLRANRFLVLIYFVTYVRVILNSFSM